VSPNKKKGKKKKRKLKGLYHLDHGKYSPKAPSPEPPSKKFLESMLSYYKNIGCMYILYLDLLLHENSFKLFTGI
jgi:hypothetical protein